FDTVRLNVIPDPEDLLNPSAIAQRNLSDWCVWTLRNFLLLVRQNPSEWVNVESIYGSISPTVIGINRPSFGANPAVLGNVPAIQTSPETIPRVGSAVKFLAQLGMNISPKSPEPAEKEPLQRKPSAITVPATSSLHVFFSCSMFHSSLH